MNMGQVPTPRAQGVYQALPRRRLKAGEQIVVHPGDRVADGVRITERG